MHGNDFNTREIVSHKRENVKGKVRVDIEYKHTQYITFQFNCDYIGIIRLTLAFLTHY